MHKQTGQLVTVRSSQIPAEDTGFSYWWLTRHEDYFNKKDQRFFRNNLPTIKWYIGSLHWDVARWCFPSEDYSSSGLKWQYSDFWRFCCTQALPSRIKSLTYNLMSCFGPDLRLDGHDLDMVLYYIQHIKSTMACKEMTVSYLELLYYIFYKYISSSDVVISCHVQQRWFSQHFYIFRKKTESSINTGQTNIIPNRQV